MSAAGPPTFTSTTAAPTSSPTSTRTWSTSTSRCRLAEAPTGRARGAVRQHRGQLPLHLRRPLHGRERAAGRLPVLLPAPDVLPRHRPVRPVSSSSDRHREQRARATPYTTEQYEQEDPEDGADDAGERPPDGQDVWLVRPHLARGVVPARVLRRRATRCGDRRRAPEGPVRRLRHRGPKAGGGRAAADRAPLAALYAVAAEGGLRGAADPMPAGGRGRPALAAGGQVRALRVGVGVDRQRCRTRPVRGGPRSAGPVGGRRRPAAVSGGQSSRHWRTW